jgi:hypothetical protein
VLSGHHHRAFSGNLPGSDLVAANSILVVHAGTAISTRLRSEPNSYNLLRIDRTRVSCTVQASLGKGFTAMETAEYALLGESWTRQ